MASISGGGVQFAYRGEWTFTYDIKNRLKSHINNNSGGLRTNLWYDALGRTFQRWTDLSGTKSSTLTRYVFDGSTLVQEHEWGATISGSAYVYTYNHITRDYLYQSGGIRQRESSDGFTFTDRFLVTDGGPITASIDQGVTTNVNYNELASSGDRQAGGSHWTGKLSNLWSKGSFLEGYGGGTSGATGGFDFLLLRDGGSSIPRSQRFNNRKANGPSGPKSIPVPWATPEPLPKPQPVALCKLCQCPLDPYGPLGCFTDAEAAKLPGNVVCAVACPLRFMHSVLGRYRWWREWSRFVTWSNKSARVRWGFRTMAFVVV